MNVKKKSKTQLLNEVKVFKNLKMIAETNTIRPKHLHVEDSVLVILKEKLSLIKTTRLRFGNRRLKNNPRRPRTLPRNYIGYRSYTHYASG